MAEEKNNPTPEELRKQIQERLESMKKASDPAPETNDSSSKPTEPEKPEPTPQTEPKEEIKETSVSQETSEEKVSETPKTAEKKEETPAPEQKTDPADKKTLGGEKKVLGGEKKDLGAKKTLGSEKKDLGAKKSLGGEKNNIGEKKSIGSEKKTLGGNDITKKPLEKKEPIKKEFKPKTSTTTAATQEEGKNKKGMIVLLAVLLVGVIGLFTWQLFKTQELKGINEEKTKQVNSLSQEKESLTKELKELYKDYENVTTSNAALKSQLEEEKQKIVEYLKQIENLQGQANKVAYYRRQLRELQKSKEQFVAQIDSLTNANKFLTDVNAKMSDSLSQTSNQNVELSAKVSTAKRVKGFNLTVEPYTSKGKISNKSKKVDMFKICITLMENELADPGLKQIYVRIVEPGGDILIKSTDNFFLDADENELAYSAVGTVDYKNVKVESCVSYAGMYGEVVPGNYDFEVYTDGQIIGSTNLEIK